MNDHTEDPTAPAADERQQILRVADNIDDAIIGLDATAGRKIRELAQAKISQATDLLPVVEWLSRVLEEVRKLEDASNAGTDVRKKLGIKLDTWIASTE